MKHIITSTAQLLETAAANVAQAIKYINSFGIKVDPRPFSARILELTYKKGCIVLR